MEQKGSFYNVKIFDDTHPALWSLLTVPSTVLHPSPPAMGLKQPNSAAPASRQLESHRNGSKPLLQTSKLGEEDLVPGRGQFAPAWSHNTVGNSSREAEQAELEGCLEQLLLTPIQCRVSAA